MKMYKVGALALALIFVFGAVPVFAQDDSQPEETVTTSNFNVISQEDRELARQQRVEERKEAAAERLEDAREAVLIRKCEAAQQRLNSLADRVDAVSAKRLRVYEGFSQKVSGFIEKLNEAGVDTAELVSVLSDYDAKVTALNSLFVSYAAAIKDAADMDCTEDPEGFEATLKEARQLVGDLKDETKALHDYLRNEVKDALNAVVDTFKQSSDTATSDTTETDSTDTDDNNESDED